MTTLTDPHLLIAPTTCARVDEEEFWKRVVLLGEVNRAELGLESFHWVVARLEKLGYPEQRIDFGPPKFGRECQVAIESILTRVSNGDHEPADEQIRPEYLGEVDARLCIVFDATAHGASLDAILSDGRYWASAEPSVDIGARSVELIFDPREEPSTLKAEAIKAKFRKRRLHLVGGSPTASAAAMFESTFGLSGSDVSWIPSEKSNRHEILTSVGLGSTLRVMLQSASPAESRTPYGNKQTKPRGRPASRWSSVQLKACWPRH